jgi:UDP-N-acetylglucosamine acyltransferase
VFLGEGMSTFIHSTAVVETKDIGQDVYIGPFCYITKNVEIRDRCVLVAHSSIGALPQYKDTPPYRGGRIVIDEGTEIREFVTVNLPTEDITYIGKNSVLMANVHIPHDARLGDDSFIVVGAAIAGFTKLGRGCYMGLNCSTHQYSVLGDFCLVGSNSFFKGESPIGVVWVGVPAKPIKVNITAINKYIEDQNIKKNIIKDAELFIAGYK